MLQNRSRDSRLLGFYSLHSYSVFFRLPSNRFNILLVMQIFKDLKLRVAANKIKWSAAFFILRPVLLRTVYYSNHMSLITGFEAPWSGVTMDILLFRNSLLSDADASKKLDKLPIYFRVCTCVQLRKNASGNE